MPDYKTQLQALDLNSDFHVLIRQAQEALGATDEELSTLFDVSVPTVHRWMEGISAPALAYRPVIRDTILSALPGAEPKRTADELLAEGEAQRDRLHSYDLDSDFPGMIEFAGKLLGTDDAGLAIVFGVGADTISRWKAGITTADPLVRQVIRSKVSAVHDRLVQKRILENA